MSHERRVFVELSEEPKVGEQLELSKANAHYLFTVLRLKPGQPVTAICRNSGKVLECSALPPTHITPINISEPEEKPIATKTLAVALAKGNTNEFVLEKGVELGVQSFIIWSATRSIVRIKSENDLKKKISRWEKIIEAAALQSGRLHLPGITYCADVEAVAMQIARNSQAFDKKLVCSLAGDARGVADLVPLKGMAHMVVGPEGDLTEEEENSLRSRDFEPMNLGNTILKVDTAALAAVSLLQGACLVSNSKNTVSAGSSEENKHD